MDTGTWVPLVAAVTGLAAGLVAGLAGTILARRWAVEDRAAAWQREDALRWHADRLQVYTRTISVLRAWDAEARKALSRREAAAANWDQHVQAVWDQMTQLELIAPKQVTDRARRC